MADSVTYVYAIARGPRDDIAAELEGIAGSPVRLVRSGELAALVSTVDAEEFGEQGLRRNLEDIHWLETTVRGHNHVVNAAAAAAPVAPLGLATVYFNDDRVRAVLEERAAVFGEVLDEITGRTEWGVKAYTDPESAQPEREGGGDTERPGAAYLRKLRERRESKESSRQEAVDQAEQVHATLSELARASRVHPPQNRELAGYRGQMVLNGAYLVDDSATDEFTSLVRELADTHPALRVELTGPWPPYSFAVLRDGT
ncbi:gas vesicle protein GvpL/GvpF [Saccharopolyspora erythraea NRRL 2338]|uniref:Gas vesicle synthesis protein n=2 Tax=Saccharopolyspora erythraea TaxID=1836 RepID=A4F8C6_SACEN|nr:GvpL/GvpF family gas vesicle protein [Saccharopolyspora erythraea]EQD85333.1 gas vesicle protein [Saccharopolyspora erythraea D]PFG94096.1 gas vesicle protein GvpL/GvpF [Saccharopolyspora erythraea NRRL 2338]QRK90888.1 GvpL/GvpF family gas vesicle protein [Saccharopolyspora erythraea]CAM00301.1 gas vesicle synthesis protein [Saccharopolyspora erythraea NRRL 2338]